MLAQVGIQFDPVLFRNHPREDREVDETPRTGESPVVYVERVARAKAEHGLRIVGWRRMRPQPLLAADTTLEVDGEIVGKPVDREDAKAILRRLSGRAHRVLTAVAVAQGARLETRLSVSEVRFAAIDEAQIASYVASGEPMDKAGAYAIQGRAAQFVEHLSGSYSGVMGLPLFETAELLRSFDFSL